MAGTLPAESHQLRTLNFPAPAESDGPRLRHGLQAMHGVRILTPRAPDKRPDRDLLQQRLRRFREAG